MTRSLLSDQTADLLAGGFTSVFDTLCMQRYGGLLSLERLFPPDSSSPTICLRLEQDAYPPIEAQIDIRHVGGNMYDVKGKVEDGPSRSFAYCLPNLEPLIGPKGPNVIHDIASFLLDALEQQLGSALLRGELRFSSASSGTH